LPQRFKRVWVAGVKFVISGLDKDVYYLDNNAASDSRMATAERNCNYKPGEMNIESHIPTASLRPFIKTYLIIESESELVNRVLPDTSLVLALRFKGQVNYITGKDAHALPTSAISGLRKSVRLINYLKETSTILIRFKETGATAFFKEPLHELFEESVSLDTFVTQQKLSILEEQLSEAKSNNQRVEIIDAFLLSKFYNPDPDKLIINAIQEIHSTNGRIKIKELADTFYISPDAFEKRFRKAAGASPKQFASIIRMKSLISQKKPFHSLTDMAFEGGYFDQSHFNKDFKLFTGQTPTEFLKAPSFW
jgi:AraC-like DNA-binding protein